MDKETVEAIHNREMKSECVKNFSRIKWEQDLINQTLWIMEKHFEKLEHLLETLPEKLKDVFATKDEINQNKILIERLNNSVKFHGKIIYWACWILTSIMIYIITKWI